MGKKTYQQPILDFKVIEGKEILILIQFCSRFEVFFYSLGMAGTLGTLKSDTGGKHVGKHLAVNIFSRCKAKNIHPF